ncbi:flagellum-specific peptidoglycan hydrolase FlgJ [Arcticibacter pallidicorallinus]|uniref:Peptidoglycan hydrolase n=1 Tax=Arcticibacter pallidicorallinus TaxID=1259464 RepID=A0A2T0U778_9SPHI|nr:glucosaminidase domain-containing protein [Arcticibacter pallidicorallinus]PRY53769.1 flagellum-specific peptidoglycan hydrolase FlgJ [Arcticibacter pallidicorallinus]
MRNFLLIAFVAFFLASCSSKKQYTAARRPTKQPDKIITNKPEKVRFPKHQGAVIEDKIVRVYSSSGYVERFKDIAIEEMLKSGIPASITLAQGMLESASGNSTLAREANNHFGIKCHAGWTGKTILKDDDAVGECFRYYNSAEESYRDHSEFLKRSHYAFLFDLDRNDYKGWARGLKKAGYATNPRYPELLISLIERYGLDRYDREESVFAKANREEQVLAQIAAKPAETKAEVAIPAVAMKVYEVAAGDTLYAISRKVGLSVDELKVLNSLGGNDIKPGQLLVVSK